MRCGLYFLRPTLLLLFLAISSSCTDQGCIEADDFGEYESQTVEVLSNESETNCDYDSSKSLTDTAQGITLRDATSGCFVTGSQTITDDSGASVNSSPGCNSFASEANKRICAQLCVERCLASLGSSSTAEPNWQSTDEKQSGKNIGVTIRPGTEIMVRASGTVTLGNAAKYSGIYIQADNALPHSKKEDWSNSIFDVRADQTLNMSFSGQWNDQSPSGRTIGAGSSASDLTKAINGARKLIAFLIPHPEGYNFDNSKTTEKEGAIGVPLLPDPSTWKCDYSGTDVKQMVCGYKENPYSSNGYSHIDNDLAKSTFSVSSDFKTATLEKYGGIIRWTNDDLESTANFNPFVSVTCDIANGECTNLSTIETRKGRMLGESSTVYITNSNSYAYEASFKSLANSASCNTTLSVSVKDSSDTTLYGPYSVSVTNSSWSSDKISVEAGHKLVVAHDTSASAINGNCKKSIAVRFNKYHDLRMGQSGFVRFTMLGGNSENCTISGRIINPSGSHSGGSAADFYEHDSFRTASSADPLHSVSVGGTLRTTSEASSMNWSKRIFVRKGQVIRFSPDSWNGSWTTQDGSVRRQCGIGMAMIIEPKPAIICPVTIQDYVDNTACTPDIKNGVLVGCKLDSSDCSKSATSDYYCPIEYCQYTINCTSGTAPEYLKTSCSKGSAVNDSTKCDAIEGHGSYHCSACADKILDKGPVAAKLLKENIFACYDLENYTGKLSTITSKTTRSEINSFLSSTNAKGATELGNFNGTYGNLDSFINKPNPNDPDKNQTEAGGNVIFQSRKPLTFAKSGRLRFFVVDGEAFNDSSGALESKYSDNSPHGSSYSGSNGMKVTPSGTLEFNNGQWLQIKLCEEIRNSSGNLVYTCKSSNEPSSISGGYPKIIEITKPTTSEQASGTPNLGDSSYMFDSTGNLFRTTPSSDKDCKVDPHGVATAVGAYVYCHTYRYNGTDDQIKDLRLTFKIFDPEVGDCEIANPSTNNVNSTTKNSSLWNGILTKNPNYAEPNCDKSNPSAEHPTVKNGVSNVEGGVMVCNSATGVGEVCSSTEKISGDSPCTKEFYCANRYSNNTGKYLVNVKVKNPVSSSISNIISDVITPVIEIMDGPSDGSKMGQAERVYKLLISDSRYKAILNMCLVVMFTFYGLGYLMGVSELSHNQIIDRIIKIGLIYLFVGETGWYWFDKIAVKFFKNGTDQIAFLMASSFDDSPELAQAIQNNSFYDKSILFGSVDKVFSLFFAQTVQKKISALLFASIFGWAYLIIIYMSFMLYVYAVANAVLIYLTAQVFISILFTLGPIFFIFTLFKQTKEMFDAWLNHIISFSLQQIFLLTTLAFFNMMMYEVIKMSLGYKICWEEVWTINIITPISLMSFWTIASLPPRTDSNSNVGNIGNNEGIPSLFSILFIWVIASLMGKFVTMMADLAQTLAGGAKASDLGKGIKAIAGEIKKNVGGIVKEYAWNKTGGADMVKRLDQKLFDSGEFADKAREARNKQYAADTSHKSQLAQHANNAVSNYKINNAAKLATMSDEERRNTLLQVKDAALKEKAAELGISPTELTRLRSDKGLKTTSDNLLSMAFQAGKQAIKPGGSLINSIDDQGVDTSMSHAEARQAMSQMNKKDREQFIQSAKDGNISVGKKKTDKAIGAIKSFGSGAKKLFTTNPLTTAKSAAKAAGRGIKSLAKQTGIHDEEYNRAEKQLADEGKINRMRFGTGISRDSSEKQLIRDRVKQNASARDVSMKKKSNSVDAITQLEREHAYQSKSEEIEKSDSSFVTKKMKQAKARIDRATANRYTEEGKKRRQEILKEMKSSVGKVVDSKIAKAETKRERLTELETKANSDIIKANKDFESYRKDNKIDQLEQSGKKHSWTARKFSKKAKQEHEDYRKAQSAKSDPEYVKRDNARKQAQVAMTRVKQEKGNVQAQLDGLQKMKTNIVDATNIDSARGMARTGGYEDISSPSHKKAIGKFDAELDKVKTAKSSLSARRDDLVTRKDQVAKNTAIPAADRRKAAARIDADLRNVDSQLEFMDQREDALTQSKDRVTRAQEIVNSANMAKKTSQPDSKKHKKADAILKKYQKLDAISDEKDFEERLGKFGESEKMMKPELEELTDAAFFRALDLDRIERQTVSHPGLPQTRRSQMISSMRRIPTDTNQ